MSHDSFYKEFEDKFRGDRDSIKARLRIYLPFLEPLKSIYPEGEMLDLGCGRGEWLELLREAGIKGQGIDINEAMIAECHKHGLKVHKAEAISFLSSLPDESLIAVTGFHIAEHLEFSKLQELVKHALRVLHPGGLLILETPNPENIIVGCTSFYVDPTHIRPLPSQLLSFLCEHSGFFRTKVLYLQENSSIINKEAISISDVLGGVSPDYAVVAQKEPSLPEHKELFDPAFNKKYGLTLNELTDAYDKQVRTVHEELMSKQTALVAAKEKNQWLEAEWNQAKARIEELTAELALTQEALRRQSEALQASREGLAKAEADKAQLQNRIQWLESEYQAAKARIEEQAAELALAQETQRRQCEELQAMREDLAKAEADKARLQDHNQWLESEWNTAKAKIEDQAAQLALTQETLRRQGEELQATRQNLVQAVADKTQAQERIEWLEAEWNAAKAKIEEQAAELALAQEAQRRQSEEIQAMREDLAKAEVDKTQLQNRIQWLEAEWNAAKAKIEELNGNAHHWFTVATEREKQLAAVYASKSWKVTAPLRLGYDFMRWLINQTVKIARSTLSALHRLLLLPFRLLRTLFLWPLLLAMRAVLRRPLLAERLNQKIMRIPWLHRPLRALAIRHGFIPGPMSFPQYSAKTEKGMRAQRIETPQKINNSADAHILEPLTPRARQIYADLKAAIERNKQEAA